MASLREGKVCTLGDTGRYLLLELPYQQMPMRVEETVFQLKMAGVTPVLAHPERIAYFTADMDRVEKLVRLGCLSQITAAALLGGFGEKTKDFSLRLLERGLVHVISSDAHDAIYRPPVLSRARDAAARGGGDGAGPADGGRRAAVHLPGGGVGALGASAGAGPGSGGARWSASGVSSGGAAEVPAVLTNRAALSRMCAWTRVSRRPPPRHPPGEFP